MYSIIFRRLLLFFSCVIGKGPLKEQFIKQVELERDQYRNVEFCFPWLDADDYPLLL
ncbi:unnamed protein product, partial [Rotaria magnacalcarata]